MTVGGSLSRKRTVKGLHEDLAFLLLALLVAHGDQFVGVGNICLSQRFAIAVIAQSRCHKCAVQRQEADATVTALNEFGDKILLTLPVVGATPKEVHSCRSSWPRTIG